MNPGVMRNIAQLMTPQSGPRMDPHGMGGPAQTPFQPQLQTVSNAAVMGPQQGYNPGAGSAAAANAQMAQRYNEQMAARQPQGVMQSMQSGPRRGFGPTAAY